MARIRCANCGILPLPLNPHAKADQLPKLMINNLLQSAKCTHCGSSTLTVEDGEATPEPWWDEGTRKKMRELTARLRAWSRREPTD